MINAPTNINGRPNTDVVKPWVNGLDITRRPRDAWIIDFGTNMDEATASEYEAPYEYVKRIVYPVRKNNNRKSYREKWWIHAEARPSMRDAIVSLERYIVTPHVSKYRLFVWLSGRVIPDHQSITTTKGGGLK
jgi:type II restriction/modification system DNA methylase subunit YeeA